MKSIHALLSPLLCLTLIVAPMLPQAARADALSEFHAACDKPLAGADKAGDMVKGTCITGKFTEKAHKISKANTIIFGVATAVTGALIAVEQIPAYGTAAKAACIGLTLGAVGKTMLDKKTIKKAGADAIGEYSSMVNTAVKGGTGLVAGGIIKGMLFDGKSLVQGIKAVGHAAEGSSSSTETGCIIATVGLALLTTTAIADTSTTKKSIEQTTKLAKQTIFDSKKTVSFGLNAPAGAAAPNNDPNAPNNNPSASGPCDTHSNNAFLMCNAQYTPEIAALVNNPKLMDTINGALGKNLGDFAKGYKGDTEADAAQYIANGLGMSSGSMATILGSSKKLVKDMGISGEAYKLGAYTGSNGGGLGGRKSADDGMEKMMADMMAKMGDMGEDGLGKDRDPASEIVFRQMELLSPDKIAENRDISLFDRAHFRMQKNIKNLEQMNWTAESNQPRQ